MCIHYENGILISDCKLCVLTDVLLEQTLVGPSPNLQMLSYLRHAVATQVEIYMTVAFYCCVLKL